MDRSPPTPLCKCFVLCRQIFIDPSRQEYTLVMPTYQVFFTQYPVMQDMSIFARWSNSHGAYDIEVQLRDLEGEILWRHLISPPFETRDPLQIWVLNLGHLPFHIPQPGKFEVFLLANGHEVASDVLIAHLVTPAPEG